MSVGALILRRDSGYWVIDEFDHNGKYIGSHGGNHSFPSLTGWRSRIEWSNHILPLAALESTPFRRHELPKPRVGLMRFARPGGRAS